MDDLVLLFIFLLAFLALVTDAFAFHQNLCIWFFYHGRTDFFL